MRNTHVPGVHSGRAVPTDVYSQSLAVVLCVKLAGKNEPCRLGKLLVARNQQTHEDCTSAGHRRLRSNLPKPTQDGGVLRATFPGPAGRLASVMPRNYLLFSLAIFCSCLRSPDGLGGRQEDPRMAVTSEPPPLGS